MSSNSAASRHCAHSGLPASAPVSMTSSRRRA
jgi:hypothetical protein